MPRARRSALIRSTAAPSWSIAGRILRAVRAGRGSGGAVGRGAGHARIDRGQRRSTSGTAASAIPARARSARVRPEKPLSPSAERILAAYSDTTIAQTPSPAELGRTLGIKLQIVEGLVGHLVKRGLLVALPGGWFVGREAVLRAAETLRQSGLETVDLKTCKELLGLSRKLLIPLLQHLDATGAVRREGDRMRLHPQRAKPAPAHRRSAPLRARLPARRGVRREDQALRRQRQLAAGVPHRRQDGEEQLLAHGVEPIPIREDEERLDPHLERVRTESRSGAPRSAPDRPRGDRRAARAAPRGPPGAARPASRDRARRVATSRIRERRERFSSMRFENCELGTVTTVRSRVRMRVERRPMSSTVPIWSPNRQLSPTRTG